MLLLRIMQQQAKFHPLAGKFAIRQTADAGDHHADAGIQALRRQYLAGCALGGPLPGHELEVFDQHLRGDREILRATVAVAIGAALFGVVGPRAVAGAWSGAVQVLAPEQEFDGVITGGHIGLDAAHFMQLAQQTPVDPGRIQGLAAEGQLPVGDDIGGIERVLVGVLAVCAGIDVIDQAFIERPGIHAALPFVDDGIAEAEDLGLLIGNAGRDPGVARRLHCHL